MLIESIGDDCSPGSLSSATFEFGVPMSFTAGLPHILLDCELVPDVDSGQKEVVVFHDVSAFAIYDGFIVDDLHSFFLRI